MLFTRLFAAALVALAPLVATPAAALDITLIGTFDGTFADEDFVDQSLTFIGTVNDDAVEEVYDELHLPFSSLSFSFGGTDYQITEPTTFFMAPLSGLAGIIDPDASKGLLRFSFDRTLTFYTDEQTGAFQTTGGLLTLSAGRALSAPGLTLPEPQAAVPEPATWAMMVLGFAVVGGALRRRSPVRRTALA